MRAWFLLAALVSAGLLNGAAAAQAPPSVDDRAIMAGEPPQLLSAYHFFRDASAREANAGLTPYELNTALYSDGALKYRYVYMPPHTQAHYRDTGVFDFPVGTVLIKTFAFAAHMAAPRDRVRFLETRLLIHRSEGWVALAYVWNPEQTEARLSPIGANVPIAFTDSDGQSVQFDWAVPNRNQCKGCHDVGGAVQPIGPTARNFNRASDLLGAAAAPEGAPTPSNQLDAWTSLGLLAGAPEGSEAPHFANAYDQASGTLDERARAYLHVNCAHCHNPQGPAHTSGLDLRYDDTTPVQWGVLKRPVAAGRGSSNLDFDIYPGHPDQSILIYRMASTDPGEMMPELGRQRIDQGAVALMRQWIASMSAPTAPPR